MPDASTIWNGVLTLVLLIVSGALSILRESLKDLQTENKKLLDRIQSMEVLVAGKYILRTDFESTIIRLFAKLDDIAEKLDGKVDRDDCFNLHGPERRKTPRGMPPE